MAKAPPTINEVRGAFLLLNRLGVSMIAFEAQSINC